MRKRIQGPISLILAIFLLFSMPLLVNAQSSELPPMYEIERISGLDRYDTMLQIALKIAPGITRSVVLATGNDFADALAGVPLAHQKNAPILLVNQTPEKSTKALSYIKNHLSKKGNIYILGGTAVISDSFTSLLVEMGFSQENIHRLAGNDRYETAIEIAKNLEQKGSLFYVVSGDNFSDALSASVLAAVTRVSSNDTTEGVPMLLVPSNSPIPKSVIDYLNTIEVNTQLKVIGGKGIIPETDLQQLRTQVQRIDAQGITRLAGQDCYGTMKMIYGQTDLWRTTSSIYLASGENYPDALAGAVLAAKEDAPLVLAKPDLPQPTKDLLLQFYSQNKTRHSNYSKITVLGGTVILPTETIGLADYAFNFGKTHGEKQVRILAGSGTPGLKNGNNLEAEFAFPYDAVEGNDGTLFISDTMNQSIRGIRKDGTVFTVAGIVTEKDKYGKNIGGYVDGPAKIAMFNQPKGIAVDESGQLFVADYGNGAIRVIDKEGNVKTFMKGLKTPSDIVFGKTGELYVSETLDHRILKILPNGEWSVFANAQFNEPSGLAVGPNGVLYVADSGNQRIQMITPEGKISTFAGSGNGLISSTSYVAGGFLDGETTSAQFNFPAGLAVSSDQSIYVADTLNHAIRRITPNGQVETLTGNGQSGKQNGFLEQAQFDEPTSISISKDGRLIIVDQLNHSIRVIEPSTFR